MKLRARALGLNFPGQTGALNAITDVPHLSVGFSTVNGQASESDAKVQTGVTAIHPRAVGDAPAYVWAGQHTLNGNGEMTGCQWIHDAGYFMGPICLDQTQSDYRALLRRTPGRHNGPARAVSGQARSHYPHRRQCRPGRTALVTQPKPN